MTKLNIDRVGDSKAIYAIDYSAGRFKGCYLSGKHRRMSGDIKSYKMLANAIIYQAAYDWRKASKEMDKTAAGSAAWYRWDYMRKQSERFFLSAWCGKLTKLDGEYILNRLKKENL